MHGLRVTLSGDLGREVFLWLAGLTCADFWRRAALRCGWSWADAVCSEGPRVVGRMFSAISSWDPVDPFHENKDIGTLPPGAPFPWRVRLAARRVCSCGAGGQGVAGFWEAETDLRDTVTTNRRKIAGTSSRENLSESS